MVFYDSDIEQQGFNLWFILHLLWKYSQFNFFKFLIFFFDDENENQLMEESNFHEIHVIFLLLVFYKRASIVRPFFESNKICLYYKVNFFLKIKFK